MSLALQLAAELLLNPKILKPLSPLFAQWLFLFEKQLKNSRNYHTKENKEIA